MHINKPVTIAVDTGNKLIKTANTSFVAGIETISENLKVSSSNPLDTIKYNGASYSVSLRRTKWERDKTQDQTYLILTLLGIAREIAHRGLPATLDIILAIGLPPGHMREEAIVKRYKDYYLTNGGNYFFTCGGRSHNIHISDVVVCPQGFAAVMLLDESVVKLPNLYMIDIGGGTCDTVHFEYGIPDNREVSIDFGVIRMYAEIQKRLDAKYGRKISETKIDDILIRGDYEHYSPEHIDLVHEEAERHMQALIAKHVDLGLDLKAAHVVFLGGGTVLLENQIRKIAGGSVGGLTVMGDVRANARGFEMFVEAARGM